MRTKKHIYLLLFIILSIAFFNSILASPHSDGLERVAEDLEFMGQARDSFAIFADYSLPFNNELISTGLAGILGMIIAYSILVLFGRIIVDRKGDVDA